MQLHVLVKSESFTKLCEVLNAIKELEIYEAIFTSFIV